MSEQANKLKQDLEKKLDKLCFIQDQTTLHVTEQFYELRNKIDIDAEEVLQRLRASKHDKVSDEVVEVNKIREEFIGILRELEKRCLDQLPEANKSSSAELYAHFKERIGSLKDLSEDRIEQAHEELALEIIEETDQLEKRLLGEETIFYASSRHRNKLGCLVYIGEVRLKRHEVEVLQLLKIDSKDEIFKELAACLKKSLSINQPMPCIIDKDFMIFTRLVYFLRYPPAGLQPKFIYMGKDEVEYAGYSPENSTTSSEFMSYRFPSNMNELQLVPEIQSFSPSFDFLDYFASEECILDLSFRELKNLDILAFPSAARLSSLNIYQCEFESLERDCLARCVNLKKLIIDAKDLRTLRIDSEFILPFQSLESFHIMEFDPSLDTFPFSKFDKLNDLYLSGSLEKLTLCKLNGNDLKLFAAAPRLCHLGLTTFRIDSLDEYAFDDFKSLKSVRLYLNVIDRLHKEAFKRRNGKIIQHSIE